MTNSPSDALSIITAQIDLYTRLRAGMETLLRTVQQKSKKGIDQLLRDPSALLIMESIIHCNEHLDKWKKLLEEETKLLAKALEAEEAQAALLLAEEDEAADDEEISMALIAAITAASMKNKFTPKI